MKTRNLQFHITINDMLLAFISGYTQMPADVKQEGKYSSDVTKGCFVPPTGIKRVAGQWHCWWRSPRVQW